MARDIPRFISVDAWVLIASTSEALRGCGSSVMHASDYWSAASIACIVKAVTRTLLSWSSALSSRFTQ